MKAKASRTAASRWPASAALSRTAARYPRWPLICCSCQASRIASTSAKYLYSVARPIPVSSAICDIVTDSSPCSATRAKVVSKIALRTSRRCASIVSFQSLGTGVVYATSLVKHLDLTKTDCLLICRPQRSATSTQEDDTAEPTPSPQSKRPATPRWVKVFAIITAVVVVLVVVVALVGGAQHGPSRHLPSGDDPRGH